MTLRFDREGADWPNRSASRFVSVGRIRWHVQVMGSGPVLLLLHGTGAATHSWRDVMPLLAARFTVIAPDLPGHGFTTGRPAGGLSMAAMAGALAELLAALEVGPGMVVGHSAGAAIAIRMTLDRDIAPRAMIGLNPALLPFPGIAAKLFPTLAKLLFVNPFAPHIFAQIARGPGEVGRFLARSTGSAIDAAGADLYGRVFRDAGHCGGAIAMMAEWDLDSFAARLGEVQVPVLLVHGDRDAAIPASAVDAAAARIDGAQVRHLSGLGHLMHEERPVDIADIVIAFAEASGALAHAEQPA
ncbi:alpha/beta fold hydrolase BchO [Sphingomonas japonica]|uniref:Magnesium chelatase accessory protein n=1 Tax=Sphingomonas japonica TaxID=511662 RepID=A0ABX0U554_9SPHN|nr:alpha/beta fold hydrolase BchO [Sphingomonas japonica]NIJ24442.1 magnesium chelatase accessory protein [Sphingomonas japonica]